MIDLLVEGDAKFDVVEDEVVVDNAEVVDETFEIEIIILLIKIASRLIYFE